MRHISFNSSLQLIADNFFSKIKKGKLLVTYPDKKIIKFNGDQFGCHANIKLNNFKLFSKLLKKGPIGLAESYMDEDFETNNLSDLLLLAYQNQSFLLNNIKSKLIYNFINKFKHYLNQNTKHKSKKNIKYHYDLGNEFYKHWLDQSMTYSSAIFLKNNSNLYDAQINKYYEIAKPLNLNENSQLLEIGCGWGGFSTYVAKNFGSKVRAITISKAQYEFASRRVFQEGLNDKIIIEIKDYRDVNERYTNIASIEMFEAVGKKYWQTYFNMIKDTLTFNGTASLQIITINEEKAEQYQSNPDFIQQYIFPGGILPSKKQLQNIVNMLDLSIDELKNYKNSYAKTLNIWNNKFQKAWPSISSQGFNIRFKKMWEYYLSYCEVGFISGSTDVSQFVVKK